MNLREQLQAIYDTRGTLTPGLLVDIARDPNHPLHSRFEWDDSLAAEAHRRAQAGNLIRRVRIQYAEATDHTPPKSVRAFTSVPTNRGRIYQPVADVGRDPIARELVLREMQREINALKRRYGEYTEFWELLRATLVA